MMRYLRNRFATIDSIYWFISWIRHRDSNSAMMVAIDLACSMNKKALRDAEEFFREYRRNVESKDSRS